jgi:hypothetical protein
VQFKSSHFRNCASPIKRLSEPIFAGCTAVVWLLAHSMLWPFAALASDHTTQVPFTYVIDYTALQATNPEFRELLAAATPTLYHTGYEMRYLGRFGFGGMVAPYRNTPYATFLQEMKEYTRFLHRQGVRWITPYLCNQTISGNDAQRYGAWEVYDRWQDFAFLGLGTKPADPIDWMQREPSGHLHYNYKRKCYLERHNDDLQMRYAPCPNNPDWRRLCDAEACNAAQAGFDGLFIDNNIIHCYCSSCEKRFQEYLREKYSSEELFRAFGTRVYGDITLYKEGDLRWWARSYPEFIPWLEKKYPAPDRRIHFDTIGPLQDINVDAAGGGMMFGECSEFIQEHVLSDRMAPTYESLRLANPALQTAAGRLRWAETLMFWSASIGDMLAEMRDAGRKSNPDFFLMPNWGIFQRVDGAIGRAEDGKDLRRWRKGASWQMFEEDHATGLIAQDIVLDYDLELRYAFACGVRAMLLPYTLNDSTLEKVHHAEIAASGGSVFVTTFRYPHVRATYRRFFEQHADLYEGFKSDALVGLVVCFDQVHYLNIDHLRQVHSLNRFLADQQIPFDHVIEDDFTPSGLDKYAVLILPNVVFMSDEQIKGLKQFIQKGGTVIAIGENGIRGLTCRPRSTSPFDPSLFPKNRYYGFASLWQALPYPGIDLDDGFKAVRALRSKERTDKYKLLFELDQGIRFKRYQEKGPLSEIISRALAANPHLMDPKQASGLRQTIWQKEASGQKIYIVHLVNKNVRLDAGEGALHLTPVTNLKMNLPWAIARDSVQVTFYQPDEEVGQSLSAHREGDRWAVTLPTLDAYGVVKIICKSGP